MVADTISKSLNQLLEWTDAFIRKARNSTSLTGEGEETPVISSRKGDERVHISHEKHTIQQMTFTFAVIALGAKLASADGNIKQEEFVAFCKLFPMPDGEQSKIQRLFMLAHTDRNSHTHYARQIAGLFPDRLPLRRDLLRRLCNLAEADGRVTLTERRMLYELADILNVDRFFIDESLTTVFDGSVNNDPYDLLGISPTSSNDYIKQAYRRRIRQLHPDRLAGEGYADEDIAHARAELEAVNAAYNHICQRRKIK